MIDESRSSDDDIDISDIINWDEAMEQVGGDEEFLKELLNDLQEELSAQVSKLYVAMVSSSPDLQRGNFILSLQLCSHSSFNFTFLATGTTDEHKECSACCQRCCSQSIL